MRPLPLAKRTYRALRSIAECQNEVSTSIFEPATPRCRLECEAFRLSDWDRVIMSILNTVVPMSDILELTAEIIRQNREERKAARDDKKQLLVKLESASGEDVFKYMNLISFANMDEFVAESRLHAQQSFRICMFSALAGFVIICASVGFAIYFQIANISGNLSGSRSGASHRSDFGDILCLILEDNNTSESHA